MEIKSVEQRLKEALDWIERSYWMTSDHCAGCGSKKGIDAHSIRCIPARILLENQRLVK